MPELASPVRYNLPVLQQEFRAPPIVPLQADTRGLAKAAMWSTIAKAIQSLPETLLAIRGQNQAQKRSDAELALRNQQAQQQQAEFQQRQAEYRSRQERQALVDAKYQEAVTPSAVAVESPTNKALGIPGGTAGGVSVGKPLLSDFTVTGSGTTYNSEDPAVNKAKTAYYESQALANFDKKNTGVTYPSIQAAKDAGVDPEGGKLHDDGTITIEKYKPGGLDAKGRAKITDSQKANLASAANLAKSMDGLMEDYDKMSEAKMAGPILGNFEKAKQKFGYGSEEGSRIASEMNTSLFRIARMLNGAGVLTDADIRRAENTAPTLTMDRPQFKGKLEAVKNTIKEGLETWLQTNAGQATNEQVELAKTAITSLGGKVAATATTAGDHTTPDSKTETPAVPSADPNGMVRMIKPDGTPIRVPASKVEDAKKLGAKLAQ